ncbi:unnamed protein product [Ixodes persulcatus]
MFENAFHKLERRLQAAFLRCHAWRRCAAELGGRARLGEFLASGGGGNDVEGGVSVQAAGGRVQLGCTKRAVYEAIEEALHVVQRLDGRQGQERVPGTLHERLVVRVL